MESKQTERARQILAKALTELAVDMESGRHEALYEYLDAMGRFRKLSWANALLIEAQRPEATRVASYRAWRTVGRDVTKAEKAIVVLVPAASNPKQPLGDATISRDDPALSTVRANYVYDVSQTEGKPIPERLQPAAHVWEYARQLRDLAAERGIELQVDRPLDAEGRVADGGAIRLPPGLSPSRYVTMLSQELARAMLHHQPGAGAWSRGAMDAQADGVAYVVARGLGLETDKAVRQPMGFCSLHVDRLAQTLAVIQRTSAQILDELGPQPRTPNDTGAISTARSGPSLQPEDFDRIHREYGSRLIESIAGFVRGRHRAEDLAARAFEKAWEKRGTFRGQASLRTWIEAIARNEARYDWDQARRVQFESLDHTSAVERPAPELVTDELEKRDDHRHLQQALAQLPPKCRRALVAHFVEGLSIRDIARHESVPEGTVLSRIFTGKQLLREAWNAPVGRPAASTAIEVPSGRPERPELPGLTRTENERSNAPEPMTWDR